MMNGMRLRIERRGWQSAGKWRVRAAGGTWRRLMVSVTPSGFPVCDGSVYRGCAIAPPPACNPSLLRSFHFAMAHRGTGVALPLHRLPVVHRSYGASVSRWFRLQGFRYRSTACLWSIAPTELPFRVVCAGYMYRGCAAAPPPACGLITPTGFRRCGRI